MASLHRLNIVFCQKSNTSGGVEFFMHLVRLRVSGSKTARARASDPTSRPQTTRDAKLEGGRGIPGKERVSKASIHRLLLFFFGNARNRVELNFSCNWCGQQTVSGCNTARAGAWGGWCVESDG